MAKKSIRDMALSAINSAAKKAPKLIQTSLGAVDTVKNRKLARKGNENDKKLKQRLAEEKAQKEWKNKTGKKMSKHKYEKALIEENWPFKNKDVQEYNKIRNEKIDEVEQWSEDMGHGKWKGKRNNY